MESKEEISQPSLSELHIPDFNVAVVVYAIYRTDLNHPVYIGHYTLYSSTVATVHRKIASSNFLIMKSQPIHKYLHDNNIPYEIKPLQSKEFLSTTDADIALRRSKQFYILSYSQYYTLLNKQNFIPAITHYKRKYRWISNQTLIDIFKLTPEL